jgi:aflatoxin B1 aldehyde reductase
MSAPFTILGTANFGEFQFVSSVRGNPQDFLDIAKKNGIKHLDTARLYGTSERVLGELKAQEQGFTIDTKLNAWVPGAHKPEALKESIKTSLKELNVNKVNILYLHTPDRTVSLEDTMKTVNEIYQEGAFSKVKKLNILQKLSF